MSIDVIPDNPPSTEKEKLNENEVVLSSKSELEVANPPSGINKELEAEIKTAFEMFDEDNSGSIDRNELKKVMLALGLEITNEEVDKFIQAVDKDNNNLIDYNEFMCLITDKIVLLFTIIEISEYR